mmetsp:Transcript_9250/g.34214  ORF Transcript_9250/g.34214 Transcript_9250/m.34214 type:complete len:578 (-) Transcript_9250:406-2139(-)|eukprot:CAMPEP_0117445084 /NCGR_PEP_ID=MMETSP0759-20121206/5598_1 /TAXON_ID=63605 /ORGANISM="Percolomonas cosmopolitus, Strain WS" /LENGTH=577 /DNA_ID=CAMNT_0005237219 /DNA_START=371 /DNA_END=2104 /DNA_ORIENTATION=+
MHTKSSDGASSTSNHPTPPTSIAAKSSTPLSNHQPIPYAHTVRPLTHQKQTLLQTLFLSPNSYFSGTFNLANSTIGAGVLLLPSVFKEAGIILGVLLLIAGAILAAITLNLIHKVWLKVQDYDESRVDYEDLGDFLFGKWMGICVKISVIIINVGACISYFIIISHLMLPVFLAMLSDDDAHHIEQNYHTLASGIITSMFAIPSIILSCLPKIADLRFFSYISLASVFFFMFMVTVGLFSGYTRDKRRGEIKYFVMSWDLLSLLGIITFAFACHTNLCPVAIEYGQVKAHRVKWAIAGSTTTCLLTFILIGLTGYLSFLDATCGDIVQSYPAESIIDTLLRCILTLSLVLTYPLAAYPARVSIDNIIDDLLHPKRFVRDSLKCCIGIRMMNKRKSHDKIESNANTMDITNVFDNDEDELHTDMGEDSEYGEQSEAGGLSDIIVQVQKKGGVFQRIRSRLRTIREISPLSYPRILLVGIRNNLRNVLEGLLIGFFALVIAIFFPYASTLFGLVGSTGSTMASYIFPTVYYIVCYRPSWKNPKLYLILFILIFGLCFGCLTTFLSFESIISGKAQERDC